MCCGIKPDAPPNTIYCPLESYGFGLDPLSGDYKVVVIKDYESTTDEIASYPLSVLVYSSSNDSWKYCGDLGRGYYLEHNRCYIFVKGCCLWLGSFSPDGVNCSEIIICFDMAFDSFQEINVPDYHKAAQRSLGVYEDSLAFFRVPVDEENLGIWTLNDGTWTKIFNIRPIPNVLYPIGHWESNKVLFVSEGDELF